MDPKLLVAFMLMRFLLPLCLLGATVLRFNCFSLMYGCLLLAEPHLPRPTRVSMRGRTWAYMIVCIVISAVCMIAQVCFQAYLSITATADEPYGTQLGNCTLLESSLRQIGLQRLEPNDFRNILRIILPDIGMFIVSLSVALGCRKLCFAASNRPSPEPTTSIIRQHVAQMTSALVHYGGKLLVALFLALSAITNPCILSAVYFLAFLLLATIWACHFTLGRRLIVVRILLLIYSGAHLILLYLYQFQFFQNALPPTDFSARLIGLTDIVYTDCYKPWLLSFRDHKWPVYASPAMILLLYYSLACVIRKWCRKIAETKRVERSAGYRESPIPSPEPKQRRSSDSRASVRQVASSVPAKSLIDEPDLRHNNNTMIPADQSSFVPEAEVYGQVGETEVDSQATGLDTTATGAKKRSAFISICMYIMQQSYAGTLLIMMAWSITFHSWLTFVYLLAACIIWMIPQKRTVCLRCSPLILCYAEALLTVQYVYGIDLDELPTENPSGYKYSEIGLHKYDYPCLHLGIQIAFTVVFLVTLRQYMREKKQGRPQSLEALQLQSVHSDTQQQTLHDSQRVGAVSGLVDSKTVKAVGNWLWRMLCKYWILVCAALFLAMAVQEAKIYRIIYMLLFLYFVISFQLSYWWWRACISVFWWVVIIYSMVVLCCLYIYQFENFPGYLQNGTGMSEELLTDIGLEQFDTTTVIFVQLLTPTSFLILIIMQLHYFQKNFLELSDTNRFERELANTEPAEGDGTDRSQTSAPQETETQQLQSPTGSQPKEKKTDWKRWIVNKLRPFIDSTYKFLDKLSALLWRLLEIHMDKIVMFTIFICCVAEVTAVNVILVLLVIICMPIPRLRRLMSALALFWIALVVLAKMAYQLQLVHTDPTTCTNVSNVGRNERFPYPFNSTIDNAYYVGLQKTDNLSSYLKNYIAMVLILVLEAFVKVHQLQYWNHPDRERPLPGITFPGVSRRDADKSLIDCLKFFVNFCFYKFGLEACYIMLMVTMVVRLDAYSVIYGIFLGLLLVFPRHLCRVVWPGYIIILMIVLILQYLACVGVPAGLCWGYPWDNGEGIPRNLKIFLYLPNYIDPPDPYKLMADFFQLLFACLQLDVFRIEYSSEQREKYSVDDNEADLKTLQNKSENPTEDYITFKNSYLDYLKTGVFQYMYWVTLAIIFIFETTRISLFCMGYLIGCFFFLWFGHELLVKPLQNLLRLWGILLGYNVFVIICKCGLQVVGCVYMPELAKNYCWVVQLFSIICLQSEKYVIDAEQACNLDPDESGLAWDAVCFVFLVLQQRIYNSFYFQHVVTELEVQNTLETRGAKLINTRLLQEVESQKAKEDQILTKIKKKMKRIQLRQIRLHEKSPLDSNQHAVVIRSGDYYMFDDDSDDEAESSIEALEPNNKPDETLDEPVLPFQIINAAVMSGAKEALDVAERRPSRTEDDEEPQDETDKKDDEVDLGEKTEEEEEGRKDRLCTRIMNSMKVVWAIFTGFLEYFIAVLHNISLEYRTVSRILDKEKDEEKKRLREGHEIERKESRPSMQIAETLSSTSSSEVRVVVDPPENPDETDPENPDETDPENPDETDPENPDETDAATGLDESLEAQEDAQKKFHKKMPLLFRLLIALYDALISHSEIVCYFAMILCVLVSASLLSLPYPFSVFLWAMLCVPRPSKSYWVTIITYTEVVVVVKYLFQFGFFPWNDGSIHEGAFWPPRIIGIETKNDYAAYDLFLLFCLFIHRSILKRHGLWKDAGDNAKDMAEAEQEVCSRTTSQASSPTDVPEPGASKFPLEQGVDPGALNKAFEPGSIAQTPMDEEHALAPVKGDTESDDESDDKKKKGCVRACFDPFLSFYRQRTRPTYSAVTDAYASMFLCDVIAFIIVVFGYNSFGPVEATGETVTAVIESNKVPPAFLCMILAQFALIIIDRALYLRKDRFGKFIFQILLAVLVHIWMFFIQPSVTSRAFTENVPAQLWYFIKCIYFGLSAYQIRSGYPTRILGNFLTKRYNYLNLFLFKGFLLIPFLLELRALMDWMWTDTTLSLGNWLKVEDIYANIFCLKCWRRAEERYPLPSGVKHRALIKYGLGGIILFLLIFIIWFPLIFFSVGNTVYIPNPPKECSVYIKFGGFQSLFQMSSQERFLKPIEEKNYSQFKNLFKKDKAATAFLANYKAEDVYIATINGVSMSAWGINPPSQKALYQELYSNDDINIRFGLSFTREPHKAGTMETVSNQFTKKLIPGSKTRESLGAIINGTRNASVVIADLYPMYVSVPAIGKPEESKQLLQARQMSWMGVNFLLERQGSRQWWKLTQTRPDNPYILYSSTSLHDSLTVISFNERIAPDSFSLVTGYGVIGLYVSLVFVVGQFVRLMVTGTTATIMFVELPYVDRILKLLLDIYMVRESQLFKLEEELYAKLIFLYRSPKTMIKWTKYKFT